MGDGKAAEKERVSYNFDDVVGGEQEKRRATIMPTRRASPGRMSRKRDKVFVREK